ncbi:MAG: 3-phytase [Chitinophagales bacterium]|jgi:3-phytase
MNTTIKTLLALSLLIASSTPFAAGNSVTATLETRSHFDDHAGLNTDVDDPAIWIHPKDKSKSMIAATLKQGGLDVYDLDGKLLQHIAPGPAPACSREQLNCNDNKTGRFNNADIVYNFQLGKEIIDLLIVSDRGLDKVIVYRINQVNQTMAPLSEITAADQAFIFSNDQDEVNKGSTAYGLTTVKTDKTYAYVSQNSTTKIAQLELYDNGLGQIAYRALQTLRFPASFELSNGKQWTPCSDDDIKKPQFEGMVADVDHDTLYLAQEDVGVWRTSLSTPSDKTKWQLFAKVQDFGISYTRIWQEQENEYSCILDLANDSGLGNPELYADVEGLSIYQASNGNGYLLVSSQGNDSVALYDRNNHQFVDSFNVADGRVDGVNETDGLMVVNANLGGNFQQGLLVMQDGRNDPNVFNNEGVIREGSNFKYISWGEVAKSLKLKTDTTDISRN